MKIIILMNGPGRADILGQFYSVPVTDFSPKDVIEVTKKWMKAVLDIESFAL